MEKKETIPVKITKGGSLGLLALGDVGLRAWRTVKNSKENSDEKK
ncbi:hypothetical protein [Mangrovimonas sp. YM274]|nr:hypothetical protein [Mangrovimonas sp. YM274]WMI69202.1 hypothetical protein RBH95_02235 [Mangrovimonas sp. YM274]